MPLSAVTKKDFEPKTADGAARHFAGKAALSSEAFEALSKEAKQQAFRIAGVHKVNLVQRARDIVHKAIEEGTDYGTVRRELMELFDTEGVPRPALSRLRLMFQQNAHQAYNDARREALDDPEQARMFPYRRYMTIGNGTPGYRHVRPTHAALHGKVFTWNDPFWDTFTPPWEFGCRCFFVPLTAKQAQRLGQRVLTEKYVRTRMRVPGQKERGISVEHATRSKVDLRKVDEELRSVMSEYQE